MASRYQFEFQDGASVRADDIGEALNKWRYSLAFQGPARDMTEEDVEQIKGIYHVSNGEHLTSTELEGLFERSANHYTPRNILAMCGFHLLRGAATAINIANTLTLLRIITDNVAPLAVPIFNQLMGELRLPGLEHIHTNKDLRETLDVACDHLKYRHVYQVRSLMHDGPLSITTDAEQAREDLALAQETYPDATLVCRECKERDWKLTSEDDSMYRYACARTDAQGIQLKEPELTEKGEVDFAQSSKIHLLGEPEKEKLKKLSPKVIAYAEAIQNGRTQRNEIQDANTHVRDILEETPDALLAMNNPILNRYYTTEYGFMTHPTTSAVFAPDIQRQANFAQQRRVNELQNFSDSGSMGSDFLMMLLTGDMTHLLDMLVEASSDNPHEKTAKPTYSPMPTQSPPLQLLPTFTPPPQEPRIS